MKETACTGRTHIVVVKLVASWLDCEIVSESVDNGTEPETSLKIARSEFDSHADQTETDRSDDVILIASDHSDGYVSASSDPQYRASQPKCNPICN